MKHNRLTREMVIVAGEPSGDTLGASLAKAIHTLNPIIHLSGMGGHQMQQANVNVFINSDQLAIVGVFEVIKHLRRIYLAKKTLKKYLRDRKPSLIIFIDYPGFNLHMLKYAKKAGIKVLYYVSPQIWAWRYGRIKKIKKYVDHMAVLFNFEEKIYQKENVSVSFVGHPLVDHAVPTLSRTEAYAQFNLNPNQPIVGLFPGSRRQEIVRLLPTIVAAVRLLQQQLPRVQWVLPLAANLALEDIRDYLVPEIQVIQNNIYNILPLCNAAIAVSGTVTLEIALHQVPLVIIYKVTPLSYWIGKALLYIPFISLCNIIAQERIAVELIQAAVTSEAIAAEIKQLLLESNYRRTIIDKLAIIKHHLGEKGSSHRVAQIALNML